MRAILVSNISFSDWLTDKLMGTIKRSYKRGWTNEYPDTYASIVNLLVNLFP